ncbi:MAG: cupin domain-containing protein [Candidatus Binataceae bacterium]
MAASQSAASLIISPHRIAWNAETPTKETKRLWFDPVAQRVVQLTRFEPSAKLPLHRHIGNELIYTIEGDVSDEAGTVTAGNMSRRPPGCVHTVTSTNGATMFAIVTGDNEEASAINGAPQSAIYVLSEIAWTQESPGLQRKQIWTRHDGMPQASLLRLEAGATLPRHRHIGEEFIFVIEGSYADASGEVRAGDMNYLPDGYVHTVSSSNGATVLSIAYGSVEEIK